MTGPFEPKRRDGRGFRAKTPSLGPDAKRKNPWGRVTKHQISGWRFQIRRIANGVALRDTRMLEDVLRRQSRMQAVGLAVCAVLAGGGLVLALIKPAGAASGKNLLADRPTNALYVRVNDKLHPVLNLASARLILGSAENPALVKSSEIDKEPRGNTLGIEGAPERIVQSGDRDARWTVCDAVGGPDAGTTVIAGDPVPGPGHAAALSDDSAVLVSGGDDSTWLVWGKKRSRIDLDDAAVASAVGINVDTPAPRSIDRALLNLIPESPPLVVPFVANAGDPPRFVWPAPGVAPVIGSVVADHGDNNELRFYAVTAEGLQPITAVVAGILRSNNAYGLVEPPELTPDQVAKAPTVHPIPVDNYPANALKVLDPVTDPVSCAQWVKNAGAPTSSLTLLAGQSLPVADNAQPVTLAGAGPTTAQRVILPKGTGFFVQITGQQPDSKTKESQFWVSDLGVRYGIEAAQTSTGGQNPPGANTGTNPAAALGMTHEPLPIPWSVLSLFAAGPTLSAADALVEH